MNRDKNKHNPKPGESPIEKISSSRPSNSTREMISIFFEAGRVYQNLTTAVTQLSQETSQDNRESRAKEILMNLAPEESVRHYIDIFKPHLRDYAHTLMINYNLLREYAGKKPLIFH